MEKLLMMSVLFCLMFGSLVEGFGRSQYLQKQPEEEVDHLENDLKDLRRELERLNITHKIPGICQVCKLVIGKVVSVIPDNASKEDVKAALTKACGTLPLIGWLCQKFVDGYLGEIFIDVVQKQMKDPPKICKAMHLCWWPAADKGF